MRTIDGFIGRILLVSESFAVGNTSFQIVLDNGMGGGSYLASQLRPVGDAYGGGHQAPAYLPAGVHTAALGPQYHGTTHSFEPGQQLTPEGAAAAGHHENIARGWLHFTDTPGRAADYADSRAKDYGGTPRVYQVEPTGPHEHDTGDAWPSSRTRHPLHVVRELPEREWDDYGPGEGVTAALDVEADLEHTADQDSFSPGPAADDSLDSHVASYWYPEMGDVLRDRPDPGRQITVIGHFKQDEDRDRDDPESHNHGWCHVCKEHHESNEEAEEHDSSSTDWRSVYKSLSPRMHRGFAVRLPTGLHEHVHDENVPVHARAAMLNDHLRHYWSPLGEHWSDTEDQAKHYAGVSAYGYKGDSYSKQDPSLTHVVVHAAKPKLRDIEKDPYKLSEGGVLGLDTHEDAEIPIKGGAPISVKGLSWKRDDQDDSAYTKHEFRSAHEHVAAQYADGFDPREEEYNGTPQVGGTYWSAPAQQAFVDQELGQPQDPMEMMGMEPPPMSPAAAGLESTASQDKWTFYHGTPDVRSWQHGSTRGIHVGTEEAAHQALNARIGKPLEGKWDGTREYGKTLLSPYQSTGNERDLESARYPSGKATYSTDTSGHAAPVPMDAKPHVFPVRIKGPMIGHPAAPVEDDYANSRMHNQITRGNARRGYFYRNIGEDDGSISAVVPSADHLERLDHHTATTISGRPGTPGTKIDDHGDAPGHGADPDHTRASAPNSYDDQSTEGEGDPTLNEPITYGGMSAEEVRKRQNGAMIGMYPEGISAGDGPGLGVGAIVASTREDKSDRWHEYNQAYRPDTLHRGVHVQLPGDLHDYVHDESQPVHERAHALSAHFQSRGGLGMHWTPHTNIAQRAIWNAADKTPESQGAYGGHDDDDDDYGSSWDEDDEGGGQEESHGTDVMFHAQRPGRRNEIRDPKVLEQHGIGWAHSQDEDETSLKPGAPLKLQGISWKQHEPEYPNEPFEHHDFAKPIRHTAGANGVSGMFHGNIREARVPWTGHEREELHSWQEAPTATEGDFVPSHAFTRPEPQYVPGPDPETEFAQAVGPKAFTQMTAGYDSIIDIPQSVQGSSRRIRAGRVNARCGLAVEVIGPRAYVEHVAGLAEQVPEGDDLDEDPSDLDETVPPDEDVASGHQMHSPEADAVFEQLSEDFPPEALDWVFDVEWQGPIAVPLDQVDFSDQESWEATQEPEKVDKFRKKIEKKEKKGKHPKPAILIAKPGSDALFVADGHHRALAEQQLEGEGEGDREDPGLWAWVATVEEDDGPWDTLHDEQLGEDQTGDPTAEEMPGESGLGAVPGEDPAMMEPGMDPGAPIGGLPPMSQGGTPSGQRLQQAQQQMGQPFDEEDEEDEGGGDPEAGDQDEENEFPPKKALRAFVEAAGDPAFRFEFTAAWRDVVAKATRINNENGVRITAAYGTIVVGEVKGDHATYEAGLQYYPGRPYSVMAYSCGCPWATFHQDADYPGRYNGRLCSHAFALSLAAKEHGIARRMMFPETAGWPEQVVVKSEPPWHPSDKSWAKQYEAPMTKRPIMGSLYSLIPDTLTGQVGCDATVPSAMTIAGSMAVPAVAAARVLVQAGEGRAVVTTLMSCAGLTMTAAGRSLSWDEIGARHPGLYGNEEDHGEAAEGADGEGIGWAANHLANDRPADPGAENSSAWDLTFHKEKVYPHHIDYARSENSDPRVQHAYRGYMNNPGKVPPLVLVHRHGVYQVADGHHRAQGAERASKKVDAYVHYSAHEDTPFSGHDGEPPEKGPFHGARPSPGNAEHRRIQRQADQANGPWGSQNVTEVPPATPYGATSPPEKDRDPGSYGPLSGPDPDNWGEIQDNSAIQMPLTNDASLHYILRENAEAWLGSAGRFGAERGRARQGAHGILHPPVSSPPETTPESTTSPVSTEFGESHPYADQASTAGPSTSITPRDPNGIRMEESGKARRMPMKDILNLKSGDWGGKVKHHLDDIREKLDEDEDGGDALRERMEKGDQAGHIVVNKGKLDDGHRRVLLAHEMGWKSMTVRSGKTIPRRWEHDPEGYERTRQEPGWDYLTGRTDTPREQREGARVEQACQVAMAAFTASMNRSAAAPDWVKDQWRDRDQCEQCGAQAETVNAGTGKQMCWSCHEKQLAKYALIAEPQLEGALAEKKDEPEGALESDGLTAFFAENPQNPWGSSHFGTYEDARAYNLARSVPDYRDDSTTDSGRAQHPDQETQQPGIGSGDDPYSPSDPSIQTMGNQQWGGGWSDSGDLAFRPDVQEHLPEQEADQVPTGQFHLTGSQEDVVAQFQRSAAAGQYATDGAVSVGDGDIAAAAQAYLRKQADVLPPEEADELIREGRGTRARNLDLMDLRGTHYVDDERLDDVDDDVVLV